MSFDRVGKQGTRGDRMKVAWFAYVIAFEEGIVLNFFFSITDGKTLVTADILYISERLSYIWKS